MNTIATNLDNSCIGDIIELKARIKADTLEAMERIRNEIRSIPKPYEINDVDRIHELIDLYYEMEPWSY